MLSHDPKIRCDLVDLYYTLYGSKRPFCLPIPELAAITKPRKGPSSPEQDVNYKYLKRFYIIINYIYKLFYCFVYLVLIFLILD